MAVKERWLVDENGKRVAVVLDIAEYEKLIAAAGAGPDPDAGRKVKKSVREELERLDRQVKRGNAEPR